MKKIIAIILVIALAAAFPMAAAATSQPQEIDDIQISIKRASAAPVIDGKLDGDASYERIDMKQGYLNLNSNTLDLTKIAFDAYISYDNDNVYILLSGDEKYHYCDHVPGSGDIWNQSCIQVSLSEDNTKAFGGDRLEVGLARNNDGEMCEHVWAQSPVGSGDFEFAQGVNYAIANENGRLNYEVAIPWTAFLAGRPATGAKFGFNFMYVWSADDIDVREKLEFSSGCDVSGKNADLFAQVTLLDTTLVAASAASEGADAAGSDAAAEPDVPEAGAAPAPTQAAATTAPRTADPITLIAIGSLISLAGAVISKKRK